MNEAAFVIRSSSDRQVNYFDAITFYLSISFAKYIDF
jgi:hypothetical protein